MLSLQLLRKDFGLLLLPTEWLNDELVNYYLLLLQVRQHWPAPAHRCSVPAPAVCDIAVGRPRVWQQQVFSWAALAVQADFTRFFAYQPWLYLPAAAWQGQLLHWPCLSTHAARAQLATAAH